MQTPPVRAVRHQIPTKGLGAVVEHLAHRMGTPGDQHRGVVVACARGTRIAAQVVRAADLLARPPATLLDARG